MIYKLPYSFNTNHSFETIMKCKGQLVNGFMLGSPMSYKVIGIDFDTITIEILTPHPAIDFFNDRQLLRAYIMFWVRLGGLLSIHEIIIQIDEFKYYKSLLNPVE